ncbi:MAG: PilC/PilY family type IV pilus protein, partial [Nitrospirota bacterium]|nr:PilC/PilY family type IV pilus protein [Nitrospirota bacterium]
NPNSADGKCSEWDKDKDGIPDTYYQATDGSKIESAILDAIAAILKRAASGTSVSVLATTGEGEGSIYQAYFFPERKENFESRKWLGYMQSLFVDKDGNLREDTNSNDTLDMKTDYILEMEYSPATGTTVNKYLDADGNGTKDSSTPVTTVPIEDVTAVWKGGETLWATPAANRTIYTTIDGSTKIDFKTVNSAALLPYLRAATAAESDNIISWVRGNDLTGVTDAGHASGYRKRSITINGVTNVWKLGDIIYSTPTVVGRPNEGYDMLYEDSSYAEFRNAQKHRRHVVYVGANDGMLHAFNAGCYDENDHKYYSDVDASGNCVSGGHTLGEELWAFIPRGLLPHLKWATMPDYTHVYYVDSKPKVADIKMFNADATHKNGWGTVLIGGFRYGGKNISWTSGTTNYSASPEYFALDITDPLNPRLLWTFTNADLGLSMSYPSLSKSGDKDFLIFGSGATNYNSSSDLTAFQNGNIFVLGISGGVNGVINNWVQNTNFWKIATGRTTAFLADAVSVDVDIDYDVDVIYLGENYQTGGNWNALLHRITTNKGALADPSQWVRSTVLDVNAVAGANDVVKRITAAPSAAMDDRANLWTFFGTGQFLGSTDKNQTDSGGFYAIKDACWNGTCTTSYSNFMNVSGATVNIDGSVSGISGCGGAITSWSGLLNASNTCNGWTMYFQNVGENVDFNGTALTHNGERMLSKPLVLGGLVTFATYIPGLDQCAVEGDSNVYAVYYKTGTAYKDYVFKEQAENPTEVVARVAKLG